MPSRPENHFSTNCTVPGVTHVCLRTVNIHLHGTCHEKVLDNLYAGLPPAAHVWLYCPSSVEGRQAAVRQ